MLMKKRVIHIVPENKKFLLVREEKWWELPWWWLEYWESPQEWIRRELYEEMWINVIRINKKPSYFITTQKDNWIWIANVIYETQINHKQILDFRPSDECLEIRFFNVKEAQNEKLFLNVREFIKHFNSLDY